MRKPIEFRTASKTQYKDFCEKHPQMNISWDQWRNIIYTFNESFKTYLLETGDRVRLPGGIGDFAISKKKKRKFTGQNNEYINLSVDWKKYQEKGKIIYNFNHHTDGYILWWKWFKKTGRFQNTVLWMFKPCRATSRLLAHYIKTDPKYQHLYNEWKN